MEQLTAMIARRDSGIHSLGEIWRRHRLSCASREQLGSYLLGIMSDEEAAYISFHIETIGCRYCEANLDDLKLQQAAAADRAAADKAAHRRKKYFQSTRAICTPPNPEGNSLHGASRDVGSRPVFAN